MEEQTAAMTASEPTAATEAPLGPKGAIGDDPGPQEPTAQAPESPETEQPEQGDALKELGSLELDEEAQAQALMRLMGEPAEGTEPARPQERAQDPTEKGTEPPAFYTPEELGNTPLDDIDTARLPEGAREYLPIVKRNMDIARQTIDTLQRQNAALIQQLQGMSGQGASGQAPARNDRPDFKALASQAAKLAKERLGLGEDDDLDMTYEPEHVVAFHMAMREIADRSAAAQAQETLNARNARNEWSEYTARLTARPDFAARDKWITERLTRAGKSPAMLRDYLRRTGDTAGAMRVIEAWNQMYDAEHARIQAQTGQAVKNQARPARKPPVLEGAAGVDAGGRKSMNLRAFGELEDDAEAQANALRELGLI